MQAFGLIGYPLGHSFSVPYFKEKFAREQIKASYRNFPLKDISLFPELLEAQPQLLGLNVTVPHKQSVIPFLDKLDKTAAAVGAVNTILIRRVDQDQTLKGFNTDVTGFRDSLLPLLKGQHRSALVLGTGGSSKAVGYVLDLLHIPFTRVSRTGGEGRLSYEELDQALVEETKLIINTTPLGMYPEVDACPEIPYHALTREHLLYDLIYNPAETRFLQAGKSAGATVSNGHDMLIRQAEASWEIWNR